MARGFRGGLVVDAGEEKGVAGDGFAGHGAERRAVIRDQTAVLERQVACNLLVSRGWQVNGGAVGLGKAGLREVWWEDEGGEIGDRAAAAAYLDEGTDDGPDHVP